MDDVEMVAVAQAETEITPEVMAQRMDQMVTAMNGLGSQMNWLCENMQSLFAFIHQVSSNGGGIRGMMQVLKQTPPNMQPQQHTEATE